MNVILIIIIITWHEHLFKEHQNLKEKMEIENTQEVKVCGYTCGCTSVEQCQFTHKPDMYEAAHARAIELLPKLQTQ